MEPKPSDARGIFNGASETTLGLMHNYLLDEPDDVEMMLEMAITFDKMQRIPEALTNYSKVVTLLEKAMPIEEDNVNNIIAAALYNRGVLFARMEDDDNALADFSRCIEVLADKRDVTGLTYDCMLNIAVIYLDEHDVEAASEMFDRAISFNPNACSAFVIRGYQYIADHNLGAAKAAFQTAWNLEWAALQLNEKSHSERMLPDWEDIGAHLKDLGGSPRPLRN